MGDEDIVDVDQFKNEGDPSDKDQNAPEGGDSPKDNDDLKDKKTEGTGNEDTDEEFDPFEEEDSDDDGDDKEDEDDDGDVADEDKKLIKNLAEKAVAKTVSKSERKSFVNMRNAQVDRFLGTDDGKLFTGYEKRIRTIAKNPAFANVKIEAVAAAAVGARGLMRMGAQIAQTRAKQSVASGITAAGRRESNRSALPDFDKMTPAQLEEYSQKVINGEVSLT